MLVLFALAACGASGTPEAAEPAPQAPEPVPVEAEAPPEPADLEETTMLSVSVPARGYELQIDADGSAWTGSPRSKLDPYDVQLRKPHRREAFATEIREAWGKLLAEHDGETLGPFVAAGTKMPQFEAVEQDIVLRMREGDAVREVTVKGDLRVPASFGPFEEAWTSLRKQLWAPDR